MNADVLASNYFYHCTGAAQTSDVDRLPYTTLSYANGPGFVNAFNGNGRVNLTNIDTREDYLISNSIISSVLTFE
jgi:hypothetical protein